jgi:hypothetical protein
MTEKSEFDRLKQICSARLDQFIIEARKTEFSARQLKIPVSRATARRLSSQQSAEVEARNNYALASMRLSDFIQRHAYTIQ